MRRFGRGLKKSRSVKRVRPPDPMDDDRSESAKRWSELEEESMWESDESNDSESERDRDEDKEEEGWIDTLVEAIMEPKDYRKREEKIMDFLKEYLFVRIHNMEYSFEKRKARKKEKKYERLKKALEILEEHHETMKYIVNKAAEYEEMEISYGEDVEENEDDGSDEDDDDMDEYLLSIEREMKGGGGKT
jgi:hypothetical protein